jgi:hypothetical protein
VWTASGVERELSGLSEVMAKSEALRYATCAALWHWGLPFLPLRCLLMRVPRAAL